MHSIVISADLFVRGPIETRHMSQDTSQKNSQKGPTGSKVFIKIISLGEVLIM